MNKKDIRIMAQLVAQWEWTQGGSSSEATGRYSCAQDILSNFDIPEDELIFARVHEIATILGICGDQELYDRLHDFAEDHGYSYVVDTIEAEGFRDFLETIKESALQ